MDIVMQTADVISSSYIIEESGSIPSMSWDDFSNLSNESGL